MKGMEVIFVLRQHFNYEICICKDINDLLSGLLLYGRGQNTGRTNSKKECLFCLIFKGFYFMLPECLHFENTVSPARKQHSIQKLEKHTMLMQPGTVTPKLILEVI